MLLLSVHTGYHFTFYLELLVILTAFQTGTVNNIQTPDNNKEYEMIQKGTKKNTSILKHVWLFYVHL